MPKTKKYKINPEWKSMGTDAKLKPKGVWIQGEHKKPGDIVDLTDNEAAELLGRVRTVKGKDNKTVAIPMIVEVGAGK